MELSTSQATTQTNNNKHSQVVDLIAFLLRKEGQFVFKSKATTQTNKKKNSQGIDLIAFLLRKGGPVRFQISGRNRPFPVRLIWLLSLRGGERRGEEGREGGRETNYTFFSFQREQLMRCPTSLPRLVSRCRGCTAALAKQRQPQKKGSPPSLIPQSFRIMFSPGIYFVKLKSCVPCIFLLAVVVKGVPVGTKLLCP